MFDYQIANPPYGKDWKRDQEAVEEEHERGFSGRFGAGLPRISDGQLLFLQHMLAHMKPVDEGGSRVAIIMNGSPLFTGDAGSGESEIRRWILENDWLEALIALPEQLFYNTGIATYVWVLTNRKAPERKGKVQLIDATSFWTPMRRKSLGDKRREKPTTGKQDISRSSLSSRRRRCQEGWQAGGVCQQDFPDDALRFSENHGGASAKVEFPSHPRAHRAARRRIRLPKSRREQEEKSERESQGGSGRQERAGSNPKNAYHAANHVIQGSTPHSKAALEKAAKSSRSQATCARSQSHSFGPFGTRRNRRDLPRPRRNPEPDPELRDTENVPLSERIESYFEREVKPYVPDAWINTAVRDEKDSKVGKVGYEINFNRYFYKYTPPRPLEEIESDIKAVEKDVLADVARGGGLNCSESLKFPVRRWNARYLRYKDSGQVARSDSRRLGSGRSESSTRQRIAEDRALSVGDEQIGWQGEWKSQLSLR